MLERLIVMDERVKQLLIGSLVQKLPVHFVWFCLLLLLSKVCYVTVVVCIPMLDLQSQAKGNYTTSEC